MGNGSCGEVGISVEQRPEMDHIVTLPTYLQEHIHIHAYLYNYMCS